MLFPWRPETGEREREREYRDNSKHRIFRESESCLFFFCWVFRKKFSMSKDEKKRGRKSSGVFRRKGSVGLVVPRPPPPNCTAVELAGREKQICKSHNASEGTFPPFSFFIRKKRRQRHRRPLLFSLRLFLPFVVPTCRVLPLSFYFCMGFFHLFRLSLYDSMPKS